MQLTMLPFLGAPDKWEDRPAVFGRTLVARVYRVLPFSYSLAGVLLIWYSDGMRHYDPHFCWGILGVALIVQGIVSYCADVLDYGVESSHWKKFDLILAPTLTFIVSIVLVCRCWLGRMSIPASTVNIWAVGCAIAVGSKCLGAQASYQKSTSIKTIMLWHNVWHSLPVLASLLVWDLGSRRWPN